MRKVIGILLIAAVVGVAIFSMKDKFEKVTSEEKVASEKKSTEAERKGTALQKIKSIDKEITESYPDKPEGLIELHNELMAICYKEPMDDETITQYVKTIRKIYSTKFTELNSEENQISQLKQERETMAGEKMQLIANEVSKVYVAKDAQGEAVSAEVNVIHATDKGTLRRTYLLNKEDGLWKINGWENTNSDPQQ